jgi:hypothetical protein
MHPPATPAAELDEPDVRRFMGKSGGDTKALAEELSDHILRLSRLAGKILQLRSGVSSPQ